MGLVSVYFSQQGVVLATQQFESKHHSKLKVVQTMLEALNLEGVVNTQWMPYTAKKTTKLIVEGGNDYVITVKGNQPRLLIQLKTIAETQKPCERFVEA